MVTAGQTFSRLVLHMGVAFGVMYALTGSVAFGGIAALIEPICNVALLPLHDKLWQKARAAHERRRNRAQTHALSAI
jgi:uncharacterized membrane protein